jgi:Flp pilus assembly protein TadD
MKRIALILVMVAAVTVGFGQKNVRQSASNYLKDGKLDKALESINQCIQDPSTAQDPKTWFIRGNILLDISNSTNDTYKALVADPLAEALTSYQKAIEFDTKKDIYEEIFVKLNYQRNVYYNAAVEAFNAKNYKLAMTDFGNAAQMFEIAKVSDTTSLLNAAYCAGLAKEPEMAKQYYLALLKGNYKSPNLYMALSDVYRQEKDSVNALKVIREGLALYPNDLRVFLAETNVYLTFGETDKALRNLKTAIQKDSTNPSVFFAMGTIYDNISNDTLKTAAEQNAAFENASAAYTKAMQLNPNYFEAAYNMGAMYVNKAALINDIANKLPFDQADKYDQMKKEADSYLVKAVPYLEKAAELDPKDINTLYSLKQIYARTGQTDKLKAVNEKIAALTK